MLETIPTTSIFATAVVITTLGFLGYFSWKTITTTNLYQKGIELYQKKDYPAAETAFRQVISINSTNDVVRLLLGDVLMKQNKIDEAKEMFAEVTRRSPKNPDAYLRLAQVLTIQEKSSSAIANLQKAKDLFQKQRQPQKASQINQFLEQMQK